MHEKLGKIINTKANLIAGIILAIMFLLMVLSAAGDSLTMDELAHIVSGYSYLTKQDYRLNPEHPPLLKDIAAIPLLFIRPVFPANNPAWTEKTNEQWALGETFLFKTEGNDADKIIFWARLPIILLALLFGFYLFRWTKEFSGNAPALLALALFAFSPNIIAHSRLVTTDLGAAFFILISFCYFWKFLENPSRKNIFIAGFIFALALLAKFTSLIIFPVFAIMLIMKCLRKENKNPVLPLKNIFLKNFYRYFKGFIYISAIAVILTGIIYSLHLKNMPVPVQHQLIDDSICRESSCGLPKDTLHKMTDNPILRPYSQYLLGVFMVYEHSSVGHTSFFMGETGRSWPKFYLVAYFIKEPIPSQILFYLAAIFFLSFLLKKSQKPKTENLRETISLNAKNLLDFIGRHYLELAMIFFIALLLFIGAKSKLQLGIRYILPIFPFLYILTALSVNKFLQRQKNKSLFPCLLTASVFLIIWLAGETLFFFPSYISYYNEFIGGPKNGYKYFVDSNTDWGQDLRRLVKFVDGNKIEKIKLDYFGGADPAYYLKDKYIFWEAENGPTKGYLAVSASSLQWHRGIPEDKKIQPAELNYRWLDKYKPIAQIGYSILVYKID